MNPKLGLVIGILALVTSIAAGIYEYIPPIVSVMLTLVFLPMTILCLGFCLMSKPKKEEEEARKKIPFIGY